MKAFLVAALSILGAIADSTTTTSTSVSSWSTPTPFSVSISTPSSISVCSLYTDTALYSSFDSCWGSLESEAYNWTTGYCGSSTSTNTAGWASVQNSCSCRVRSAILTTCLAPYCDGAEVTSWVSNNMQSCGTVAIPTATGTDATGTDTDTATGTSTSTSTSGSTSGAGAKTNIIFGDLGLALVFFLAAEAVGVAAFVL